MPGLPEFSRLDAETLIHAAAKLEFYLFAITFLIVIGILSVSASFFFIRTAMRHAFPGLIGWLHERWSGKATKPAAISLAEVTKQAR